MFESASSDHAYGDWARAEVLPFLPAEARVILDAGCSSGGFGRAVLAERPDATVWGIEPHPEAAELARPRYSHVITGYFPDDLPEGAPRFDAIVFNDVLEHMVEPAEVLARALKHLTPSGVVVASIPNVRHYIVLQPLLLKGRFDYAATGILDRTHLRFFTRATMVDLFAAAGYEVVHCAPINLTRSWKFRALRRLLPRLGEELSAVQYVLVGRPNGRAA